MTIGTAIIDWLQFTLPLVPGAGAGIKNSGIAPALYIHALLTEWGIPAELAMILSPGLTQTGASPPYNAGGQSNGICWYWHDTSPHVDTMLCQITGTGCAYLRARGALDETLNWVHERVSRIDIARDIQTDQKIPDLFTTTKRVSHINTKSGQTYYVGSMKSDKYARVYTYSAPHPRAGFVRFECVYRRKYAAEAARVVIQRGVERAWGDMILSNRITLEGALQREIDGAERLRIAPPVNTGAESTLVWLIECAAPAFRRLAREGKIDAETFVAEHFTPI